MTEMVDVVGCCADRFTAVREVFERSFAVHGDLGAACAVVERGQLVVDLWGGHLDIERRSAWGEDTLVNLFSVTKMAPAVCAHLVAQQQRLDLDAPVATYWPEFAGGGKGGVTLADVLAHRCGVPTVRERLSPEDLFDWERMTTIIANTEPWFAPGASCAYQAYTFGFIIGEVIRRVDGRGFGRFLNEEIAIPRGLDVYVGLPADHDCRVSPLHPAAAASSPPPENIDDLALATLTNPAISVELRNTTEWRRAEVPSSNGQATARSLAQLCGALADDDTDRALLNASTVERIVHGGGPCTDRVLSPFMGGAAMDWSLGFMRNPVGVFGTSTTAIGYTGMGGSVAYFDPGRQLGVAYLVNQMRSGLFDDPRRIAIAHAVDTATR